MVDKETPRRYEARTIATETDIIIIDNQEEKQLSEKEFLVMIYEKLLSLEKKITG